VLTSGCNLFLLAARRTALVGTTRVENKKAPIEKLLGHSSFSLFFYFFKSELKISKYKFLFRILITHKKQQ
jgi:hypothetical protein